MIITSPFKSETIGQLHTHFILKKDKLLAISVPLVNVRRL